MTDLSANIVLQACLVVFLIGAFAGIGAWITRTVIRLATNHSQRREDNMPTVTNRYHLVCEVIPCVQDGRWVVGPAGHGLIYIDACRLRDQLNSIERGYASHREESVTRQIALEPCNCLDTTHWEWR